jgi:hypothetical protein
MPFVAKQENENQNGEDIGTKLKNLKMNGAQQNVPDAQVHLEAHANGA